MAKDMLVREGYCEYTVSRSLEIGKSRSKSMLKINGFLWATGGKTDEDRKAKGPTNSSPLEAVA